MEEDGTANNPVAQQALVQNAAAGENTGKYTDLQFRAPLGLMGLDFEYCLISDMILTLVAPRRYRAGRNCQQPRGIGCTRSDCYSW